MKLPKYEFTRRGGEEWVYKCSSPLCLGRDPRLELNITTGVYHCFRCGVSGQIKELAGRKRILEVPSFGPPGKRRALPNSILNVLRYRGMSPEYVTYRYGLKWDGYRICIPVGRDLEDPDCWWRRGIYSWQEPKVLVEGEHRGVLGEHLLERGCYAVLTEGDYKAFSVIRRKEKASSVLVPKMRQHIMVEFKGFFKVIRVKHSFVYLDQSPDHEGIIIRISCYTG